jgi:hypothetical protein
MPECLAGDLGEIDFDENSEDHSEKTQNTVAGYCQILGWEGGMKHSAASGLKAMPSGVGAHEELGQKPPCVTFEGVCCCHGPLPLRDATTIG